MCTYWQPLLMNCLREWPSGVVDASPPSATLIAAMMALLPPCRARRRERGRVGGEQKSGREEEQKGRKGQRGKAGNHR